MTQHEIDRAGALAWLAGRLHFERLLAELHLEAETAGALSTVLTPASPAPTVETAPPARPARAA